MKEHDHTSDSIDAAFDAHCKAVLEGRSIAAPAPSEALFAASGTTGSHVYRAVGVVALLVCAGGWWMLSPTAVEDNVQPSALEMAPSSDVLEATPVSDAHDPLLTAPEEGFSQAADAGLPNGSLSAGGQGDVALAAPSLSEAQAGASGPEPEAAVGSLISAVPPSGASTEASSGAVATPVAEPVLEAEAMMEDESTKPEPSQEIGPEPIPEASRPDDGEGRPVLTLPLTLPAGGGCP